MEVRLLSYEVSDLCLGKPPLRPLPISATVADALEAIKSSDYQFISVWTCNHSSIAVSKVDQDDCRCIGKVCMVDIICYLCREENLESPSSALKSPVSVLISDDPGLITHVDASLSLMEAINIIVQGCQNLVVPIKSQTRRKLQKPSSMSSTAHNNGREFCWLTEEDVIRFLLSSIGLFSPTPTIPIETLGIVNPTFLSIDYHSPASSSIYAFSESSAKQTSVAVVDSEGILIGEISPFTLSCFDETLAAAITTLSTGDLMAYIDCGGPPEELVKLMKSRLKDRKLDETMICSETDPSSSSPSSSDDETASPLLTSSRRYNRSNSYSARMVRSAEAIVCHPWSSLVAVMIQAIAHRVNYVWVIEEDYSLIGIVTFSSILGVFHDHLQSMV